MKMLVNGDWVKRISANLKSKNGESLIELLVVIALMGIIMVPVSASLLLGLKTYQNEIAVDAVFTDQESAWTQIKDLVRRYPYNVSFTDPDTDHSTLNVLTKSGQVSYYVSEHKLYRQTETQTILLCDKVSMFGITSVSRNQTGNLLSFELTLTATESGRNNKLSMIFALDRY